MKPECGCGQPAPDATICRSCRGQLERDLGDVPAYAADLDTVLARQARYGEQAPVRRGSTVEPLPFNVAASEVGWVLRNTLVGWVRVLDEDGEQWPANTVEAMSRWLLARVDHLAQHEAGDQAADEIGYAVDQVRRVIDRPAAKLYVGPCQERPSDATGATLCGADLWAGPGHQTVVCGACGASYSVAERREWLLASLKEHLATATEIAHGVSSLGVAVTPAAIRGYAHRRRLIAHGVSLRGDPLYRCGDVLGLVDPTEAQVRAVRDSERVA